MELIKTGSFYNCKQLNSLTIPESVSAIESGAFTWCSKLRDVYCRATTPPIAEVGNVYPPLWYAFSQCASNLIIYVPTSSVEAYKNTDGWCDYANNIVGYDFSE